MEMTVEQFLADVADHKMSVLRDDGMYRHLRFRAPKDSWNQWFEVVTWPGCLIINGDMGTWSFSRVDDMFTFFRSAELRINASYWGEKIQSESRFGGPHRKFHAEVFKSEALRSLDDYGLEASRKANIVEALKDEVFTGDEDESYVRRLLADFKHGDFQFTDACEIRGDAYTFHFLWCLHAIVWAIQQFDKRASEVDAMRGASNKT